MFHTDDCSNNCIDIAHAQSFNDHHTDCLFKAHALLLTNLFSNTKYFLVHICMHNATSIYWRHVLREFNFLFFFCNVRNCHKMRINERTFPRVSPHTIKREFNRWFVVRPVVARETVAKRLVVGIVYFSLAQLGSTLHSRSKVAINVSSRRCADIRLLRGNKLSPLIIASFWIRTGSEVGRLKPPPQPPKPTLHPLDATGWRRTDAPLMKRHADILIKHIIAHLLRDSANSPFEFVHSSCKKIST